MFRIVYDVPSDYGIIRLEIRRRKEFKSGLISRMVGAPNWETIEAIGWGNNSLLTSTSTNPITEESKPQTVRDDGRQHSQRPLDPWAFVGVVCLRRRRLPTWGRRRERRRSDQIPEANCVSEERRRRRWWAGGRGRRGRDDADEN